MAWPRLVCYLCASGLIWALAALLKNTVALKRNFAIAALSCVFILCIITDYSISCDWYNSGKTLENGLISLRQFQAEKHKKVIVWCAPDKINRVTIMKIGLQQTIQWGLQDFNTDSSYFSDSTNVISQLRVEAKSGYSVFTHNARFLPEKVRSSSIFRSESFLKISPYIPEIKTFSFDSRILSQAKVILPKSDSTLHLFFDGKSFKKIE